MIGNILAWSYLCIQKIGAFRFVLVDNKKYLRKNDPKGDYISSQMNFVKAMAFTEKLINIGVKKIVYIKISPCG